MVAIKALYDLDIGKMGSCCHEHYLICMDVSKLHDLIYQEHELNVSVKHF